MHFFPYYFFFNFYIEIFFYHKIQATQNITPLNCLYKYKAHKNLKLVFNATIKNKVKESLKNKLHFNSSFNTNNHYNYNKNCGRNKKVVKKKINKIG